MKNARSNITRMQIEEKIEADLNPQKSKTIAEILESGEGTIIFDSFEVYLKTTSELVHLKMFYGPLYDQFVSLTFDLPTHIGHIFKDEAWSIIYEKARVECDLADLFKPVNHSGNIQLRAVLTKIPVENHIDRLISIKAEVSDERD